MKDQDVTGLVLAGGMGARMGGIDKGLQLFKGRPLVDWVVQSLAPQVTNIMISANRHVDEYRQWGYDVVSDEGEGFSGPLAGMLAGLRACTSEWMVTAPCDTPVLPLDWVARLRHAASQSGRLAAMVRAPEISPESCSLNINTLPATPLPGAPALRSQPVFCLLHRSLVDDLASYLAEGERKIERWTDRHGCVGVDFETNPGQTWAFTNLNSLRELGALENLL
jgi:molybdopterin-guanine dinucleotide biosynthesis protein A